MNISIKQRIYWSFFLLVCLFVLNGIVTILTIDKNKKLSEHLSGVVEPSLQVMEDFEGLVIESKMYSTNWVFLRSNAEDKKLLEKLHDSGYPALKARFNLYSSRWVNKNWVDSLNHIYSGFEELLAIERNIMGALKEFKDYDDPVIKLEAERKVEEEILPRTAALLNALHAIHAIGVGIRTDDNRKLEKLSMKLRVVILLLAITIICAGFFLSLVMAKVIIGPINRIRYILNDLGKGITRKIDHFAGKDEIGKMVESVNSLSGKLLDTAAFATEIGNRNFGSYFEPLSDEDTLGKALIAMRDNIKSSDEKLNQAQHIAHLGSWERDVATGGMHLSDEMFNILDIDPAVFDFRFQSIVNLIHPESLEDFKKIGFRYLEDHHQVAYECRIITPKGETKNVFVQSRVILDADGKVCKTIGIVQDITEGKKAEEQIKLSNERYELVTKTTNDMIWDLDLVKNTIFRTENYSQLFGADDADRNNIGKWIQQVHPQDRERVSAYIRAKLDDPDAESWELEFRYYRYNGEMAYLYDRGYIIRDENKKAIRMVGATNDITGRKKAEQNNAFKAELLNTVGQAVIATDMDGIVNFWNRAAEEIYGWKTGEAIGKNVVDLTPALQTKAQAMEIMYELSQGRSWSGEFIVQRKDGGTFPAFVTDSPVYDQHLKPSGIISVSSDITERKKTEETLSNNELRFRTLTDSAPVGIFQTDGKGKTIYVNETWLEYTGMSFAETMGEGWLAAIHPVDRGRLLKEWNDRLEKGLESSTEYRLIDKKGNTRWVMGKAVPIFNKSGELFGHIGTVSDITEEKLAIESLQQSEIKYRRIVETAQEGIWLIDENDRTSFVNKKMCEIIEYPAEELMGNKIYHFMNDESRKNSLKQIEERKQGASEIHDSVFITKSGKPIWLNISTNPVFDEDGKYKGALAMMTDITRRKQHDELLLRSEFNLSVKNKELEQKNKELEQFAYVASHDLQEPLRTTSSFVELFQQQYKGKLDAKADKYLHYITESSQRMKVLITDLLEYSRIGSKRELKLVDCNTVLDEVLQDLGKAIRETGAEIRAEALPLISAYPTEMKQLFQNLVFNSIKFRQKSIPPRIKISSQRTGEGWQFAFADNGIGIARDYYERIFIIFQRLHTRNEYHGSGIGLSHCKKIVELHKGKIWLESELGKGTTFYFTIPQNNS